MKKILGLVALATLVLASCQKNEGPQVDQELKSVTINLDNVKPATRSLTAGVNDNTKITLKNLTVFFVAGDQLLKGKAVDGTTVPSHYFEVGTDGFTWEGTTDSVNENIVFHFVDPTVTDVVVVGNLGNLENTYTSLEKLEEYVGETIDKHQNTEDLPLYKKQPIETAPNGAESETGHPLYQATVVLEPNVSRIEIEAFRYTGTKYASVEIEQVVLDNYYTEAYLGTSAVTTTPKVATYVTKLNAWDFFRDADANWANDILTNTDNAVVLKEDNNYTKTYTAARPAYNFFPKAGDDIKTVLGETGAGDHPQLVVKILAKKSDGTVVPHFLKTKKFFNSELENPTETAMTEDVAKVYRLDFEFDDTDLQDPEKCVEVNVNVVAWDVIEITPEF